MRTLLKNLILFALPVFMAGCAVGPEFKILSGSENKTFEKLVVDYGISHGYKVKFAYKGSVDIMLSLKNTEFDADAVWPANSIWISMGDTTRRVKYAKSIMTSPIIFGIKASIAKKLGFTGRKVKFRDILQAVISGKLHFIMTSASQSNSGAQAFLGFLYALLGNPNVITSQDLAREDLVSGLKALFKGVVRTSGSSGWLKELFLKNYDSYDAMINYESLIIEANQELVKDGKEPLMAVYPIDGLTVADSPLGFISHHDTGKEKFFNKLQDYLLSDKIQKFIASTGRRTGFGGTIVEPDPKVFNPDWGIDPKMIISGSREPAPDVILNAIHLYQRELRKPSITIYCLDYSGSMQGNGEAQLKKAMSLLLTPTDAEQYFLEMNRKDITVVIPFANDIKGIWTMEGNEASQLEALKQKIVDLAPGGQTDLYSPIMKGLQIIMDKYPTLLKDYMPAIILMTDGQHNTGATMSQMREAWAKMGADIPVFSIMFGDASKTELDPISEATRARVFDGRADLVGSFKEVKSYN